MDILTFIIKYWYLFAALAVVLGLLAADIVRRARFTTVSPMQAVLLINRQDALVLDVRDGKEFGAGHIVGAINLPFAELKSRVAELNKYKSRPIVVACRSGQVAPGAAALLRENGIESVNVLAGGMMAWERALLPADR